MREEYEFDSEEGQDGVPGKEPAQAAVSASVQPMNITQEHARDIAVALSDFTIPLLYLRKNSPVLQKFKGHTPFSPSALNFIALMTNCANPNPEDSQHLGDLLSILKQCESLYDNNTMDFLVAAICYTLTIEQLFAIFLEFAPSAEEFNPKFGFCRGDEFYAKFFPHFAETFGQSYLDAVASDIKATVKEAAFTFEDMKIIEEELKRKDQIPLDKLNEKSRNFIVMCIEPSIEILKKHITKMPPEFCAFFFHAFNCMEAWGRKDVNPTQQLFGLFFTKFVMPQLALQNPDVTSVQHQAIKTVIHYLQHLSTRWTEDPNSQMLFAMMNEIAKKWPLNFTHFPSGKEFNGDRSATTHYLKPEHFVVAEKLLRPQDAVKMREQFERTPREHSEEHSNQALLSARSGSASYSVEPEKADKGKCAKACTPGRSAITGVLATSVVIAAVLGNAPLEQKMGLNIHPVWAALGWESSFVAAIPPFTALLFWVICSCVYVNRQEKKMDALKKATEVDRGFIGRKDKRPLGETTEEEEKLISDDAEEGDPTPRLG